ncbi:hypothetical protein N9X61_01175 [Sulfurimonas sp.]|nr:hypothetical protein [Sulfurimonas sp.]
MKKLIIATMVLVGLAPTVSADMIDDGIKKQCQYIVYGNGSDNSLIDMMMIGIVAGHSFKTTNLTDFAQKATRNQLVELACKEAFNNNKAIDFMPKFQWGVSVTMDKQYMNQRTIK